MEGHLTSFEYSKRLDKAKQWARKIIQFPFVRKVSLTGSMATGQTTPRSDIDLFIQIEPGNLWWVRLAITIWIHLAGERRTLTSVANKLCLNWFATFDGPAAQKRQHIVLAGNNYNEENELQPQSQKFKNQKSKIKMKSKIQNYLELILHPVCPLLEFLARNIQEHRFRSDERTYLPGSQVRFTNTELGFHPPK
jgi:hypothetical protein